MHFFTIILLEYILKCCGGEKDINESCLGLLYSVFHKKGIHITQ